MDTLFSLHNSHLEDAAAFAALDPHLKRLYASKYVYHAPIIDELPTKEACIAIVGGGRQIGKTTLLKQWMEKLLEQGVTPQAICFYSGELIEDYRILHDMVKRQLAEMPQNTLKYFIIDEITYIKEWDRTIKFLADAGLLDDVVLVLTGSDLILMQDARKRFPGRRGKADKVDFHYYPLSFKEFLTLKGKLPDKKIIEKADDEPTLKMLFDEFEQYLQHGGFLTAINQYAEHKKISTSTYTIYSDWIRGDIAKQNKKELFLRETLEVIIKHYNKQISWNTMAKGLSIQSVQTLIEYIELLESMDAVFVQRAIVEEKLKPAIKKDKRHMFCDPFIFHAVRQWLDPNAKPLNNSEYANLVEACVVTHFRRFYDTYYIKAKGEVDIAYVDKKKFWPVEVKWTNQLRTEDLQQIQKYKNSVIFAKKMRKSKINGIPVVPLPVGLLMID